MVTLKDVEDGAFLLRQVGEAVATLKGEPCAGSVLLRMSKKLSDMDLPSQPTWEAEAGGSLKLS